MSDNVLINPTVTPSQLVNQGKCSVSMACSDLASHQAINPCMKV